MSTMLSPHLVLAAYAQGLFPMDIHGTIRWFSPDPRAILPLDAFHVPRTLRQVVRQGRFEIRTDTSFGDVIRACGRRREGTWIGRGIIDCYVRLHELGYAHSVEAWLEGRLAGGLYGVALGGAFFGESMFHVERDASKAALVALVERLRGGGFVLLDVQYTNPHLARFGAVDIPRSEYLGRLRRALNVTARW